LVDRRFNWGADRVYYIDAHGELKSIPGGYTSVIAEDPFVRISQGRAYFRTKDLLALIEHIHNMDQS
jgi:hypothetical protein